MVLWVLYDRGKQLSRSNFPFPIYTTYLALWTGPKVEYLYQIKKTYPRYTRDQLQFIIRAIINSGADQIVVDTTLDYCIANQLFNGIDFEQVLMVFIDQSKPILKEKPIVLLNKNNLEKANQTPQKSDINDYENIINPLN